MKNLIFSISTGERRISSTNSINIHPDVSKLVVAIDIGMLFLLKIRWAMNKNLGWLFDIGDFTIQLYGDYNKPL